MVPRTVRPSHVTSTSHAPVTSDDRALDPVWVAEQFRQLGSQIDTLRDLLAARRKPLLTVDEVAEFVGRSAYTVRRWIAEQRLRAIRVDGTGPRGKLLIPRAELDNLVAQGLGANVPDSVID